MARATCENHETGTTECEACKQALREFCAENGILLIMDPTEWVE